MQLGDERGLVASPGTVAGVFGQPEGTGSPSAILGDVSAPPRRTSQSWVWLQQTGTETLAPLGGWERPRASHVGALWEPSWVLASPRLGKSTPPPKRFQQVGSQKGCEGEEASATRLLSVPRISSCSALSPQHTLLYHSVGPGLDLSIWNKRAKKKNLFKRMSTPLE